MAEGGKPYRFPWVAASLGALLLIAGLAALLRPLPDQPAPLPPAPAPVGLVRLDGLQADRTLQEEAALRDPEELYLPTVMNTGQFGALSADERVEPTMAFPDFQPRLSYGEGDARVDFPSPVAVPPTPVAALRTEQGRDGFRSIGRRTTPVAALPLRLGAIQVTAAADGLVVLQQDLPLVSEAPREDWSPLQLMAVVDLAGLVGVPAVTVSSGSGAMDAWLPGYLMRSFRLGARLKPGIYHISLGP